MVLDIQPRTQYLLSYINEPQTLIVPTPASLGPSSPSVAPNTSQLHHGYNPHPTPCPHTKDADGGSHDNGTLHLCAQGSSQWQCDPPYSHARGHGGPCCGASMSHARWPPAVARPLPCPPPGPSPSRSIRT